MQLELGKVVGVWGVKGWIKLHSYTRNRVDIANYSQWWLRPAKTIGSFDTSKPVSVLTCRAQGPGIVAQLKGVDSRELAEQLNGCAIYVDDADLPVLPSGEYYWQQLIGLQVENAGGEVVGQVHSMLETGANDVLIVKSQVLTETGVGELSEKEPDVLIPYIKEVVLGVDLEAGVMRVDWDTSYLDD